MLSKDHEEFTDPIEKYLTPSKEEQILRSIRGECPHNKGWSFDCICHNSKAYSCNLCGEIEFY